MYEDRVDLWLRAGICALLLLASISLRAAAFQLPPPSCLPRAVGSCPTPAQAEPRALVCPRAADAAVSSQIGRSKRRGGSHSCPAAKNLLTFLRGC